MDKNTSGEKTFILMFEFKPFTRKHLVAYLRNFSAQKKYLQGRLNELYRQLRELDKKKIVNGENIDERIQAYAYGSRNGDGGGGNSNHYNPDTLFNQWIKIYEPYETQRKMVICSIMKILYRQWQMECVYQCVEQLEVRQRDVIMNVYIRKEKVLPYCKLKQLGHDKYNRIKEGALNTLLSTCNESLENLQTNWKEIDINTVSDPKKLNSCG